jgi:lysophospholipase L1-like esterase
MKRLHEQAATSHIRFVVVLIPTKETVFREQWQNPYANFRTLTETEERFWKTTREFLKQNDIEFLEALPALREQLGTGMQPYPVSQDGHPNEAGHRAIAKAVAAYLESH